jgi:hypothetical protein
MRACWCELKKVVRISQAGKVIKVLTSPLDVGSLRCRTPRATFAGNEVYVDVCHTDPPIRGVQFHAQTSSSFSASKARGVQRTRHSIFCALFTQRVSQ